MAANKRYMKATSQGIGESQPHIAPEGSFPPLAIDWDKLTIGNGHPIAESIRHAITYEMTDQGIAEKNAKALATNGAGWPRVEFGKDPVDKQIDKYGDDLDIYGGDAIDPMAAVMKEHLPAGHRGRFMGPRKTKQYGMRRRGVKYEAVLDKNGNRVELGDMVLASAPAAAVERADRHFRDLAADRMIANEDNMREQAARIMGDGGMERSAKRRRELDSIIGTVDEDAETANREAFAGIV